MWSYRFPDSQKCVNCGWNMTRWRVAKLTIHSRVSELSAAQRELLTNWLPPIEEFESRIVCQQCTGLLKKLSAVAPPVARQFGHREICAACGDSLLQSRKYHLDINKPEQEFLFKEHVQTSFKELLDEIRVCRACIMRAERAMKKTPEKIEEAEEENKQTKVMIARTHMTELELEGYYKVRGHKGSKCAACGDVANKLVNLAMRQQLLLRHKLYISTSVNVCETHCKASNWNVKNFSTSMFSSEEIADIVFLLKDAEPVDFERLENLHPFILRQWIGMTIDEFRAMLERSPVLRSRADGALALAVLLASRHTGECATVLASATQRPREQIIAAKKLAGDACSSCGLTAHQS